MCIEGLLLYFRELSPGAMDRLARARLLSVASGQRSLIALTSAWLAHIHFNSGRYVEMADAISVSLSSMDRSNLPALCRVAMLLGDAFLYTRNAAVAQAWYDRARNSALELGDQAFVGALTYNRSALRVFLARVESGAGVRSDDHIRLLSGEVQSAINYQAVAQLRSLDHLLETSRVGVFMLQRNFSQARPVIEALLSSDEVRPKSSQASILKADLALCFAELRLIDSSLKSVKEILSLDLNQYDAGDRVLIYSSISDSYKSCGETRDAEMVDQLLSNALVEQRSHTDAIEKLLVPFLSASILN
jgi:tetratricopeptide (TPR) repeat protein